MMARRPAALAALGRVAMGGSCRVRRMGVWPAVDVDAVSTLSATVDEGDLTPDRGPLAGPTFDTKDSLGGTSLRREIFVRGLVPRFSSEDLTQASSQKSRVRCHKPARNSSISGFLRISRGCPRHPADSRARSSDWRTCRMLGFRHTYVFGNHGGHLGPPQDAAFILPSAVSVSRSPVGCPFCCSPSCPSAAFVAHPWAALVASRVLPC
jgi:hypothetical protein